MSSQANGNGRYLGCQSFETPESINMKFNMTVYIGSTISMPKPTSAHE